MQGQGQGNLQVDQEVLDMIKLLQEILPAENANEVLKVVLWTFMAFIQGDDEEGEQWHEHTWCGCGQGHCH